MKVLHLPTETGGNAWGLAKAEKELGLLSEVLVEKGSYLGYEADIELNLHLEPSRFLRLLKKIRAFSNIRNRFDIYHFNYGTTLFTSSTYKQLIHFDLPFYSKKAKLFVSYNGCDARQKYPTMQRVKIAACHCKDCYGGACNSGRLDEYRRLSIQKMSGYVKHMWALNPDLLHFLPEDKSSFLPYAVSALNLPPIPFKREKKLKIIHAPTNQVAKGSLEIIACIEKLKKKYPESIDFELISNLSHKEAIEKYKTADLIIDQILIGWYGGFAVETMQMGKPVIARIAKEDLKFIPKEMAKDLLEAIIHADPFTLSDTLEYCLQNPGFLKIRGSASIEYVKKWHDPKLVAQMTKEKYES